MKSEKFPALEQFYQALNDQPWEDNNFFLASFLIYLFFRRKPYYPKLFVFYQKEDNLHFFERHVFPFFGFYQSPVATYRTLSIQKPLLFTSDKHPKLNYFDMARFNNASPLLAFQKKDSKLNVYLKATQNLAAFVELTDKMTPFRVFFERDFFQGLQEEVELLEVLFLKNYEKFTDYVPKLFGSYSVLDSQKILICVYLTAAFRREVRLEDLENFIHSYRK